MKLHLLFWACVFAAGLSLSRSAAAQEAPVVGESSGSASPAPLTAAKATVPETVIYGQMREIRLTTSTDRAVELRQALQTWRGYAHERRRKVDGAWVLPREFARKREAVTRMLTEAQDLLKSAKTDTEKQAAQTRTNAKILQAAQAWQDPLTRTYLMGLANFRAGKNDHALTQAKDCVTAAPFLPGFQQLYGASLLKKDRPLDASAALALAVRLRNDRDSVSLLRQALGKVPGIHINGAVFKQAQETLQAAQAASNSTTPPPPVDPAKLAPPLPQSGRPGSTTRTQLPFPLPAFDRLTFRQAVAVPVASNALLLDSALADATELYVRLGTDLYATAKVRRVTAGTRTKPLPLTLVTVDGVEFTPISGDKETVFQDGQRAVGSAVGVLMEMGMSSRPLRGRLSVKDGVTGFGGELLPGESAAPVLTAEGQLAGMLLGRTDVTAEHGGPATFVPLADLLPLLEQARKAAPTTRPAKGPAPKPAPGQSFTVIGVMAETFEK